jgi:hypothetical protein
MRAHGGRGRSEKTHCPLPSPGSPAVAPPSPFRLTAARRTAAYATYRFLAPVAMRITVSSLRRAFGNPNADIAVQR